MKGIVLAGGTGSRLGSLTVATNKHLLPLGREPMLFRAIKALNEAGIAGDDLAVVAGRDHLDAFSKVLQKGCWPVPYLLCQEQPNGVAGALDVCAEFAQFGPVIVVLADNIWEKPLRSFVQGFEYQVSGARALLSLIGDISILQASGVAEFATSDAEIIHIHEKPDEPPSCHVATGAYAFDATVWDILSGLEPSARGELEITDVLNNYAERELLQYDVIPGFWCDAGQSVEAYYKAVDFVRHQERG